MDAIGWDVDWKVIDSGGIDLENLYGRAESQSQDATIENRDNDVKEMLDSEAYKWTSRASYSGWWQTEGYFSNYNDKTTPDTGEGLTPSSNDTEESNSLIIEILTNQWLKDNISDYLPTHKQIDNFRTRGDSTPSSNETEKYNNLRIEILNDFQNNHPDNDSNQDDLSANLDSYINQWLKDNISDYLQKFGFELNLVP